MDPVRPPPVDLLTELLQGYRHPAAATDEQGVVAVVVYMNPRRRRLRRPLPGRARRDHPDQQDAVFCPDGATCTR